MSDIGLPGIILLIAVALLLFGPKKLPELGNAFGRTVREFRKGAQELMNDEQRPEQSSRKSSVPELAEGPAHRADEKKELPE